MIAILTAFAVALAASIIDWQKLKTNWADAFKRFWMKYIIVFTAVLLYYLLPTFLLAASAGALVYMFSDLVIAFVLNLWGKITKKKS